MRAHKKQFIEWTLLIVLWLSAIPGWSQEEVPFAEENTYIIVSKPVITQYFVSYKSEIWA